MGPLSETEMQGALEEIEEALPSDRRQAFGILVSATAASAIDAGMSDIAAVDGLITSLQSIRAIREDLNTRVN